MAGKGNGRTMMWIVVGILFAIGSVAIHHQVKIEGVGAGSAMAGRLGNLEVGSESPDFSATDLQGRQITLSELLDHKVVVVDFWATWCGPCLLAMPGLQEVHDEFSGRGVEVLAVNLGEGREQIQDFLDENGYTFPVVADQDLAIGGLFGVSGIPAQVVVNREGLLESIQVGYSPGMKHALRRLLERLTQEAPPQEALSQERQ